MKNYVILVSSCFLVACSNPKEPTIESHETATKISASALEKTSGAIPMDNPIYITFRDRKKYTLDEVDQIYKVNLPKYESADYYPNLKHIGFKMLCENGLIENGSDEQKRFYLKEQIESELNFPNFENFFNLLKSCNSFLNKDQILKIGNEFYNKNKAEIEKVGWPNAENKKQKIINLNRNYILFKRYVSAN